MVLSTISPLLKAAVPVIAKRNFSSSYVLFSKVSDPVQQLFLDKIREFGSKISDKNFVKQYPELQTALDEELARVTRQYGGEKPEDLAKFPSVQLEEPEVDPQPGF